MPGSSGSSWSQRVGKEPSSPSSTLLRNAIPDVSILRGYQEQFAMFERQNQIWLRIQASRVREAQARADSVHFDRNTIRDYLLQTPTERLPGLKWWPPKLRLGRSDLCAPCRAIDFEAAFTTPRLYPDSGPRWIHTHKQDTQSFKQVEINSLGVNWPVNSNCQFCRYLANAVDKAPMRGEYTIVFHNENQCHHDEVLIEVLPCSLEDASGCLAWLLDLTKLPSRNRFVEDFGSGLTGRYSFHGMLSASNTIICHRNRPIRKARAPQIVSPVFDGLLAKSWFDMCSRKHRACSVEDDIEIPKTRLIDCITRRLVSTGSDCQSRSSFVALSYVWGAGRNKTPRTLKDDLPTDLPQTIDDAITVTKALGFQYLWVDQYCIDQGDKEDKQRQIVHMDLIYKCADLTIIAAAGNGCDYGLPGVSACPRDVLDPFVVDDAFSFGIHPRWDGQYWKKGSWHTRGWTFQEALLSRRRLVFSDTAMHYECKGYTDGAWQSELCGGVECAHSDDSDDSDRSDRSETSNGAGFVGSIVGPNTLSNPIMLDSYKSESASHKGLLGSFLTYISLATQYTTRTLSHDSDALNAFRGAANAMQHFEDPVYSINGVPFVVPGQAAVEDNLVQNSFLCGLSWRSTNDDTTRSSEIPSWSWANVRLWNVTWTSDVQDDGYEPILTKAMYLAHDMHIEFDLDGKKELFEFGEFAKACRNSTPLRRFEGNPTALCFSSRILCSRFTSRDLDDKNEYFLGESYSDIGNGAGRISVHIYDASTDQQSDESAGARSAHESQPLCLTEIGDEKLYEDVVSQRYSLVLLRFDSEEASVLVVEWLGRETDGTHRTARRVGICKIGTFHHYGAGREEQTNRFLRCFSIETKLRLI